MKHRTAIAYLLGFCLLFAGYAASCLQDFWRKMPLYFSEDISAERRKAIEEWYRTSDDVSPIPFDFTDAVWSLSHPWYVDGHQRILVHRRSSGEGAIQVLGAKTIVIFHDRNDLTKKSVVRYTY